MIHVGDITKINGAELEPVDCVCGGSPCQDLSVAGKRAGLEGERSGLYMEQVRILKELRAGGNGSRFMVWENVPGAFSSAGGKDFAAVLEEAIKVVEPDIPSIEVPKGGWPQAGVILTSKSSFAWRQHDACLWGVPQRRKRISLVCDFGGFSAMDIVFGKELDTPVEYKKKGKREPFVSLYLSENILGEKEWADANVDYSRRNITEAPTIAGTANLWDSVSGKYTELESKLSNILEQDVDKKYYLSAKACQGILTRAERRGKALPEELRLALENQAKNGVDGLDADSSDEDVP